MKKKILIAVDDFTFEHLKRIKEAVHEWAEVEVIPQGTEEEIYKEKLMTTDICIGWPSPEWIKDSRLQLLQIGSSGWDAYQQKGLEAIKGFSCCSAKGIYTTGVAEHAIAMMFALVRRIPVHVHDKDQKQFRRHLPYATEINGAYACVIGMGEIGTAIAKRCKALGMNVIGVTKNKTSDTLEYNDITMSAYLLNIAVAAADHIFLSVPGLPGNEKLFNREIFSACKVSAFFYNISRGTTVDEEVLYEYLSQGKLAGAGLDVTETEPLPATSKLWELGDNVLITGHSAGLSSEHTNRFCRLVIRNLVHYRGGTPLENKVI